MTTPYMNMPSPSPTQTVGPDWAYDIAACLNILDQHDHSTGQGQPIKPNGMNINADLTFQQNNAISLRSTRFYPQSTNIVGATDIGALYVVGNELYYNDVTGGHQVQITTNGSVNAGAGSITGLPSGTASASYSAGTFTWQSATATAANMDFASAVLRNNTASSKGLTLQPPGAMAADYSLTLPALPVSQSFMTVDASGNMAGYAPIAQGITRSNLAAVGQQISSSSSTFATGSGVLINVPSVSVTITTTGRPVMVFCQHDGNSTTNNQGEFFLQNSNAGGTATTVSGQIVVTRGGTIVNNNRLESIAAVNSTPASNINLRVPPGAIMFIDTPSAGTYTYQLQVALAVGTAFAVRYTCLAAYEL